METEFNDLDDIGALFMKNSSPNVTLGVGPNIAAANSTVIKTGIVTLKSLKSAGSGKTQAWLTVIWIKC